MAWNYLTQHGRETATPIIKLAILPFPRHVLTSGTLQDWYPALHWPELWEGEECVQRDHHTILHSYGGHCHTTGGLNVTWQSGDRTVTGLILYWWCHYDVTSVKKIPIHLKSFWQWILIFQTLNYSPGITHCLESIPVRPGIGMEYQI